MASPPPGDDWFPSAPEGFSAEEWAILATVAYGEVFRFAPTAREIAEGLVGARLGAEEVESVLAKSAVLGERLGKRDGYYFLKGSEELVERRRRGAQATNELLARHQSTLRLIAALPFVRMVALSGGTAFKNSLEKEDLDLFVVARAGRAFTAYTLLAVALRLLGVRPVVCANYWVDERNLEIRRGRDLFTASQLAHLVPVYGRETWRRFLEENRWVREYLPNTAASPAPSRGPSPLRRAAESALHLATWPMEPLLRALLAARFAGKAWRGSDVFLGDGVLKLHMTDHRVRAMDRWRELLQALAEARPSRTASR